MKNVVTLGALSVAAIGTSVAAERPNIIIIMTDQQRADLCGREGVWTMPLTPFADSLAQHGAWFNRAYTPAPASVPARTSFLTGRFPKATEVDSNHNVIDAKYGTHLFETARQNGYATALVGKNHSFLNREDADYWDEYSHNGHNDKKGDGKEVAEFEKYLRAGAAIHNTGAAPFGVEVEQPYRIVRSAARWIKQQTSGDKPFVLWLSFPEPHNPNQVCEPYYSMFSPENQEPETTDAGCLPTLGKSYEHLYKMLRMGQSQFDAQLKSQRGNYLGMIRLIDDQEAWLFGELERMGVKENTIIIVIADHGDYGGRYGLMKKGVGLRDALTRIPMIWYGPGVEKAGMRSDHVSLVDIFPTLCEVMGVEIPLGVQGRSLWPMLSGADYPVAEFRSIMSEGGYGGQYYTEEDGSDYIAEGAMGKKKDSGVDCLNTWTQSGAQRMVRMGDWKLLYDMEGNGQMFNMKRDPMELKNLFNEKRYASVRSELLAELLRWEISTQDQLPVPRRRYIFKRYNHNYLFNE